MTTPGHPLPTDMITPGGDDTMSKRDLIIVTLLGLAHLLYMIFLLYMAFTAEDDSEELPKSIEPPYYSTIAKLNSNCGICLENFKQGDRCRELPCCKYMFHDGCVDGWVKHVKRCPKCRTLQSPKDTISFITWMKLADVV